jgi:hypothetical protein
LRVPFSDHPASLQNWLNRHNSESRCGELSPLRVRGSRQSIRWWRPFFQQFRAATASHRACDSYKGAHVKKPETGWVILSQAFFEYCPRALEVLELSRQAIASTIALKVGLGRMAFVVLSLSG